MTKIITHKIKKVITVEVDACARCKQNELDDRHYDYCRLCNKALCTECANHDDADFTDWCGELCILCPECSQTHHWDGNDKHDPDVEVELIETSTGKKVKWW